MRVSCKCVSESNDIQILLPTRDVSVRTLCRATVLAGRLPSRQRQRSWGSFLELSLSLHHHRNRQLDLDCLLSRDLPIQLTTYRYAIMNTQRTAFHLLRRLGASHCRRTSKFSTFPGGIPPTSGGIPMPYITEVTVRWRALLSDIHLSFGKLTNYSGWRLANM